MAAATPGMAPYFDPFQNDPFQEIDIPPELEDSIRRHREHLARLIANLRLAGVDEAHIEQSVSVIIESYKAELTLAVKRMMR